MSANSKIEWTDHTFNPWIGCTKVSEGCKHCYAESVAARFKLAQWGPSAPRRPASERMWAEPRRWDRAAHAAGTRARVFCASMADVLENHPSIRPEWRTRLFSTIERTPHLDWLLLTKRPENWARLFCASWPFDNAMLGITIEDREALTARRNWLANAWLARGERVFLSYEPALGPVDFSGLLRTGQVRWLIAGGESGPHARPADPDWFRAARDQCAAHRVPFFFKQWGTFRDGVRLGKRAAGRLLDGREHNEFPVAAP